MVDNVVVTPGSGKTVLADEVVDGVLGTGVVQMVKIMDGTLDGTTKAAVGAGGLKVDPTSSVAMNTGARSATTQRVTVATDDVVPAAQSGTWTVQPGNTANTTAWKVDGSAVTQPVSIATAPVLVAGTALIGKVGVDQTTPGTTNAVSVAQVGATTVATGSGVMTAGTQRVAIASDSPGVITTGTAGSASAVVLTVQGIAGATPLPVGGVTVTQAASSTITRPANTTAYASGQLVANSVTAGSVTNLQFTTLARVSGGSGVIIGAQIQKSTNTTTNAAFRLHLFNTAPTYVTSGDGTAMTTVVQASAKGYLGYIDITAMVGFSDVAWGSGAPDNSRGGIPYVATAQIIYGLLEARGAYTPGNAEVLTVTVDALQD